MKLPILDYAFLAFESEDSPKHVAGLQIFKLPRGAPKDFVANLVEQVKGITPAAPFNMRLHTPLFGMPEWQEDADLNLDDHVFIEAVAHPNTVDALLTRIAEIHAPVLDRTQALWELYFFENLKPGSFAVYFKVHHAYMDGISLSKRAMAALSENADEFQAREFWGLSTQEHQHQRSSLLESVTEFIKATGNAALIMPALAKLGLKHGLRLLRLSGRELPVPFTAPRTVFNCQLTSERSVAVADLSLPRIQAAAHHAGVTVNDVLLELCDSAMTQYLQEYNKLPERPLVAQMPISLRQPDGGQNAQGNQITIALLELGSTEKNVIKRLQRIHSHAEHTKQEFVDMSAEAAEIYTLLLQSIAQFGESTGLGQFLPPLGNVVISNVVGPSQRLYMAGAPLQAIYPISTIPPGLAINITGYTYNNTLHLGIVAGKSAIPDPGLLVEFLHLALSDLEILMGLHQKPKRKSSKPKGVG